MNLSAGILLIVGLGLNSPAEAVQVEQQHDGLPPHLQQDPGQPEQLIAGSPRSAGGAARVHPVILVPGDGGSQIEAKLNKTEVVHYWCSKTSDWYDLWLNIEQMLTLLVSCWVDNVRLVYDPDTHTTSDSPGVETRIPGFGNTTSVEFIDKSMRSFSTYFALIVAGLVPQGYNRGENIHGAPYDFRRAANEHGEYFKNVKALIEETFERNNETSVVLVCHSMGSIMMHYFLQQQTQAWKDKHVRALITLAGVWGGTARALKVFALGDNLDSWFLNSKNLLWERTNPSLAWLMPQQGFWPDDEVLVETEKKNFTRKNISEFFDAFKEHNMALMVDDTKDLLGATDAGLPPPNVEVFCIHGSQVKTTERLIYPSGTFPPSLASELSSVEDQSKKNLTTGKSWWPFPKGPSLVKGDGDGTVNIRSLEGCLKWKGSQKHDVHHKVFKGINHVDMLRRAESTGSVIDIIDGLNKQLQAGLAYNIGGSESVLADSEDRGLDVDLGQGDLQPEHQQVDEEEKGGSRNIHPHIYPIIEVSSGRK